ncbi:hypothetical protein ACFWCF_12780 [Rhodococcus sp. NPDC060090]|uniref:hypothetical protein n=1 Tax=Rhodococcus sp. NPDC060090 TaxID=3347056 RepID=UPI00365CDF17
MPILLFVVPQLVASGVVEVGGSVKFMVVLPTLIGLPCSLIGATVGVAGLLRRRTHGLETVLMTIGQVTTVVLALVIAVWAFGFASTGWELLFLPTSLMVGQVIVAAGLIKTARQYRASLVAGPDAA